MANRAGSYISEGGHSATKTELKCNEQTYGETSTKILTPTENHIITTANFFETLPTFKISFRVHDALLGLYDFEDMPLETLLLCYLKIVECIFMKVQEP